MPHVFDIGDLLRITGSFTDANNTAIDPTVVKVQTLNPAGLETTYTFGGGPEIVKDSAGHYHIDVNLDTEGPWYYRVYSTGTGQAAERGSFDVVTYHP
jgi:hypothetical protein